MPNNLYKVIAGGTLTPLATDLNQYADALAGANDIGQITLAAQIIAPSMTGVTATAAAGSGLGVGAYSYKFTYVVGYKKSDNTIVYGNETNGSASVTVTTTSGNQKANLAGLPTAWPATAVAMRIYRTAVGGADGTQKLVATITTPSATYADTTADASLGAAVPTVNATGTMLQIQPATSTQIGGIKVGTNITVQGDGTISVPTANSSVLGLTKAGAGINIAGDGTISATPASIGAATIGTGSYTGDGTATRTINTGVTSKLLWISSRSQTQNAGQAGIYGGDQGLQDNGSGASAVYEDNAGFGAYTNIVTNGFTVRVSGTNGFNLLNVIYDWVAVY